jgi:alpha-2-macroglobulin
VVLAALFAIQDGNAQERFIVYGDIFTTREDVNLFFEPPTRDRISIALDRLLEPTSFVLDNPLETEGTEFGPTVPVRNFSFLPEDGSDINAIHIGRLPEGVYVARVQHGEQKDTAIVYVSRLGLLAKRAVNGTTVWATDLITGEPVIADVYRLNSDATSAPTRTKQDGLALLPLTNKANGWLLAHSGNSWAFCEEREELSEEEPTPNGRSFLYTDRPTYHPGDMVHLRGLLMNEKTKKPLAAGAALITVQKISGRVDKPKIDNSTMIATENAFGSFSFDWLIPQNTELGEYSIGFDEANASARIRIEPDTAAAFIVTLESAKSFVLKGEIAVFRLRATGGTSLAESQVRYSVTRGQANHLLDHWNQSSVRDTPFSYSDLYENGFSASATLDRGAVQAKEPVLSGKAILNQKGESLVSFPIERETNGQAFQYVIKAEISDANGRISSATQVLDVLPANLKINLEVLSPPQFVGDWVSVRVQTTGLEGMPVAATVKVALASYPQTGSNQLRVDEAVELRTNADGVGAAKFKVASKGSKYIRSWGFDAVGRELEGPIGYFRVATDPDFDPFDWEERDLPLQFDRTAYAVNSTITASVENPFPGTPILFTLETDTVKAIQVVRSNERIVTFKARANAEAVPSAYITASLFHGTITFLGRKRVLVNDPKTQVQVQITVPASNPTGQTIPLKINTRDFDEQGLVCVISVSVVDEAVLTMRPDDVPNMHEFLYRPHWPRTETTHSQEFMFSPPIVERIPFFGAPDLRNEPTVRQVHSHFGTAFWAAALQTDANGDLTIPVNMPKTPGRWRITVRAHTMTGAVGEARTNFDTTQ